MDIPAAAPPPAASKKILMVEDDESLANIYIMRLQAEGFEVRHLSDGDTALATCKEYRPDIVLLDVMMPKVSGFDVLTAIRQDPITAKTKIIMLTALGDFADRQRGEASGADEYLVKSQVAIAEVVAKIKTQLGMDQTPAIGSA